MWSINCLLLYCFMFYVVLLFLLILKAYFTHEKSFKIILHVKMLHICLKEAALSPPGPQPRAFNPLKAVEDQTM